MANDTQTAPKPTAPVSNSMSTVGLVGPTVSLFAGLELKGSIFAADDGISVQIPGGRNFGGVFRAKAVTADVNGRQIAISGEYDESGLKTLEQFEGAVKASYYNFKDAPQTSTVQKFTVAGKHGFIRWERENKANPKSPVASYYLSE